jgi:AcrR family transcriptional regulator
VARIPAAQRRQDFVRAAIEVIATHGLDGATTRRIADQAEANLALLHYCYDSKEALFADVHQFVVLTFRGLATAPDPGSSLEDAARKVLCGAMKTYLDSPSFTAAALEITRWASRQPGARGTAVYDQATHSALRAAASKRRISPTTIEEIAYVIAALADGFALNWMTHGNRAAARRHMATAEAVLQSWLTVRLEQPAARSRSGIRTP